MKLASSVKRAVAVTAAVLALGLTCVVAYAQSAPPPPPDQDMAPGTDFIAVREVPAGTAVKVILLNSLSSEFSQSGDPVRVRVAPDDTSGVPKSVVFVGYVRLSEPATNSVSGELALRFDGLAPVGRWQPAPDADTGPVEEADGHFYGGNAARGGNSDVGIGAAAGAVIGGSRKRKLGDIIEGGLLGALGGYAVQKATTHTASDIVLKNGQEVTIILRHPITLKTEMIAS